MYIKKEDFLYFENLYSSLDETLQRRFMHYLLKEAGEKAGKAVSKIEIVGDDLFSRKAIDPGAFVTKTMIRKAYEAAKEEKLG